MKKNTFLTFVFCFSLYAEGVSSKPIEVAFLNPGGDHWFWEMTIEFMQAAAEDLDVKVEVITSDRGHLLTVRQAAEVVNRENPPDYVVTGNEKSNAGEVIRIANQAGVNVFLINNGFVDPEQIEEFGDPGERYGYWIGEIIPDNFSAGYKIGDKLISRALELGLKGDNGEVNIAAIAGTKKTHSSVERVRGLRKAVEEHSGKANLLQVFPGDWTAERAKSIGRGLFRRYEETDVVWGVNDSSALGAMDAAVSLGIKPGEDVLFGGCGWYLPAVQKVKEGALSTTVGGHFMEAGWAMVMIYDFHHGKSLEPDQIQTEMLSIDRNNVEKLPEEFFNQEWGEVDFKKFSKVYNPDIKKYNFNVKSVLQQL